MEALALFWTLLLVLSTVCPVLHTDAEETRTYQQVGHGYGESLIGDDLSARTVFNMSDFDQNSLLTEDEFKRVFRNFDNNSDNHVTTREFLDHWQHKDLGTLDKGLQLFMNLDVNKDWVIDMDRDMMYIFLWFDVNRDSQVTESEFVTIWIKMYS
ncbi:uncharacterized protein LOC127881414 [Dreissena polymorpha]|uniref:EF-hand domain-containing protein n=1 Tax=Dreissena polymorpha TaxID=45954 RepID=A0A9D4JWN9_DREPO|nr:uncharacterized protein LOC127881414 [Dreissena polymorpha]KAH3825754.1 hypothetical protein DPMN_127635 [Dreissena polymorpha]